MMLRQRSSGVSASDVARCGAPRRRGCAVDSGTIFGRAVVPDVCSTSAISAARPTCPGLAALAGVSADTSSVKLPAGPSSVGHQLDDRHADLLGHGAHRAVHALLHDHGLGLQVVEIELELVGAIGGIERRRAGAPTATAMNDDAISGPFGTTMATRSSRPMPTPFSVGHRVVDQLLETAIGEPRAVPARRWPARRACPPT